MDASGSHGHLPCLECGASLSCAELRTHVCEWDEWLDYQVLARRQGLDSFEQDLGVYLASSRGRFDLWCAARDRLSRDEGLAA